MKFRTLLWCWLQYWPLRFVSNKVIIGSPEIPNINSSIEQLTKNQITTNLEKRNAVVDEFKTLDEDINTVKKLKIMVEVFERIKKENPVAYDRMVRFFEENEKAHRLRRSFLQELRSLGRKKKVEVLEQKLDSSVKCHPKSGKELIHMFIRGLSELYPDMTKLLLRELEGAMESKGTKKTTVSKHATVKQVDKKVTTDNMDALTGKPHKGRSSTEATCSKEITCSKCPESTTICCPSTCSSTCASSCTTNECESNCDLRFAGRAGKEDNEEAGDMRIHPTARLCKKTVKLVPKAKSKKLLNENLTLTAPFKDFQVQGSIMFSNPRSPIRKSIPKKLERTIGNSTSAEDPSMDKARIAENWRDWYPRSDSANVVSPVEGNGFSDDLIQSDQSVKSGDPLFLKGDPNARIPRENSDVNLIGKSLKTPTSSLLFQPSQDVIPQPQFINDPISELSATGFSRTRNKKRSMYVLYE